MQIQNATPHHVVTHPELFCRVPTVLADSWSRLKEARGQTVDLDRCGPPAYLIVPDGVEPRDQTRDDVALRSARVSRRVRDHATACGYPLPPYGGDAA